MEQCFCGPSGGHPWKERQATRPPLQVGVQEPQTLGSHWCWQSLLGLPRPSELGAPTPQGRDICPWGPVGGSFSSLLPCCSVSCEHGLQPYICSSWLLDLKILLNCYENEYVNRCKPNTLCLLLNLAQSNYQDGAFIVVAPVLLQAFL